MSSKPWLLLSFFTFVPGGVRAAETGDIAGAVAKLNEAMASHDTESLISLFAAEGEIRIGSDHPAKGVDEIRAFFKQRQPWSETTPSHFENRAVRMISPDVALVYASETSHGSVILRRSTPAMLVLKKEGGQWRIVLLDSCYPAGSMPP